MYESIVKLLLLLTNLFGIVVVKGFPTSRSIPDHASELAGSSWSGKLPHGHSYNAIDSGISLYSSDYMGPYRPKM